ncbi:Ger(x)C family spore germination protein [Neobacillus sp. PS3-40]|uniref:Ger(x)C family spore germination protein n=1 Tax=Neobacillus sp. PS3-40 TaxID=3070679 RepID=UPI0027DF2BD7|nr:Ger(x)C family spore germination protein [Neobacillus sp. PS3-40]WML44757.1 Ger(x)C family spore germination protein [Neobacillus sp. PS3-40]
MKKFLLLTIVLILNLSILTGCWNYREVEKLAIVAGVAIDKGKNNQFRVTVEIIQISGGKDTKITSKLVTIEGKTIFDAVRNAISLSGKKLYWSHTKVVVISKDIAKNGILRVVDWYNRDSETRSDVNLLISKEKTAREVLEGTGVTDEIKSFELADTLKNEKSLSKAPTSEIWQFINDLESPGIVNVIPTVSLNQTENNSTPQVMGLAIFKKAKLIGFLNGRESKSVLFVKDEVKGGLLVQGVQGNKSTPVSLEIFKSKTKMEPVVKANHDIEFNVTINTTVAIDEIGNSENLTSEPQLEKLKRSTEAMVKKYVENCIKKVQSDYGVDIFGFGEKLREEKPRIWNRIGNNWEDKFKELKVNVKVKVDIKGSGMFSQPIEVGD